MHQFLENLEASDGFGGQEAVEIGLHEAIEELDDGQEMPADGELNQIIIIGDAGANSRQSMATI